MSLRKPSATSAQVIHKPAYPQARQPKIDAMNFLKLDARSKLFVGLCSLCGEQCPDTNRYCRAHEWAAT